MLRQDQDKSMDMINAILEDEAMSLPAKQLIKAIFKKQQDILIVLDDVVRSQGYRNQYTEKRLDELLEKVDPEEAKKRKQNQCESSGGIRVPSRSLI